ncbi:arylesterase [Psychrobacter sanguinis]|uniref:arylesterase n=1 Tax=Psychrobacter sanguinis TaxID=861445 RepID=UPI00020C9444|nr:arylesterase [Psychrobacter sanguinis]EGK13253.1 GDSL family lipase [Psychrobacter sp. 1501(2011)]MCC3308964.1 arylesterase [Psychrobacter sanguinis]MCD9150326.1 arylesterase [Psychrobacter sanguinis]UEC26255.1 arylesterase [Psychrobacter sanguinis]
MSYPSLISRPILKPLALTLLTSLALMGCQPSTNSSTDKNAASNEAASESSLSTTAQSAPTATKTDASASTPATVSAQQVIEQPITILALGDSLTEGLGVAENEAYPAQLEAALKQAGYVNAKVINSGLSGETSSGLVNRLDWVLKTKPDITILTTGANDAMRGIEVPTIDKNIRTTIKRLQDEGSVVVLGGMQIYDNLGDDYVKSFSAIYPKIAKDTGVAFIPFFLEGVGGDRSLNQADAIHPTKEGYTRIVNNNILPVLTPAIDDFVKQHETASQNK